MAITKSTETPKIEVVKDWNMELKSVDQGIVML